MARKGVALLFVLVPLGLFASVLLVAAQSLSPREQLQQYVAELKKNPGDQGLREKIIKLALTLEPKPAVPEEAQRHFVKAVTFQKEAKDATGYNLAIKAYGEALLLAPWWPEAHWNLSVVQETTGLYDDAMRTVKLYLLTNPPDASEAKNRLYALEAKKELAAKEKAGKEAKDGSNEFLKKLDGGKWVLRGTEEGLGIECIDHLIEIQGRQVTIDKRVVVRRPERYCWGGAWIGQVEEGVSVALPQNVSETRVFSWGHSKYVISDDGQTIRGPLPGGTRSFIFRRTQ